MIVPMKKVSLIILGERKKETLKTLRKLGLLHIEIYEGSGEKLENLKQEVSLLESSIFTVSEKLKKGEAQIGVEKEKALLIAKEIDSLAEEKKVLIAEKSADLAELERLKNWGEIDPDELKELQDKGIDLSLYEMSLSEYGNLSENSKTLVLFKSKSSVRFLVIKDENTDEEQLNQLKAFKTEIPKTSTRQIKENLEKKEKRIEEIEKEFEKKSQYIESMKSAIKELLKDTEFETYRTGMAEEQLSKQEKTYVSVSHFKGYIEAEKVAELKKAAKDNAWGLLIEEPTVDDDVPTKLKNNKFVSLIYPLTDFLGTVPGYFEHDISGWFLGFILIFFGIIFGDGGYGLLITAVAAIPILKAVISKRKISPAFLLVGLFGLSTILWGTLTCTWFGLSPEQLPLWLKSLSIPVISNVYAEKNWYPFWTNGTAGLTTAQNLQIFCFSLALVQLTVAHIKAARNRKSIKILGDIGSILELIGIYYVVLALVVNAEVFSLSLVLGSIPVGTVAIAFIGIGFILSFIFSNYEGSVIKSILASFKDIVSVLLGVVNVFSDIVSYIRLWAVGLAGAAISATVNELAGPLLGNFLFMILAIVLLVFGHGLNMILNILSVIVHGIRLNTLEFSSHLDMSWSGHKFKPFEE